VLTYDKSGNRPKSDQPSVMVALVTTDDCIGSISSFPGVERRRAASRWSTAVASECATWRCVASAFVTSSDSAEPSATPAGPVRPPLPLLLAAALVGVEALTLVGYGVLQLTSFTGARATMVLTSTLFFVVYGGGLGAFAWLLHRLRSWSRAPVVLAQLLQLGVAWSFRGGTTTVLAVVLAVVAVAVLAGVFHPESLRAVERAEAEPEQPAQE
jgi:hypothetical protein